MAVSEGGNTGQKAANVANFEGRARMGPKPPARAYAHHSRASPTRIKNGADTDSSHLIDSVPLRMNHTLIAQNSRKQTSSAPEMPRNPGGAPGAGAMPG